MVWLVEPRRTVLLRLRLLASNRALFLEGARCICDAPFFCPSVSFFGSFFAKNGARLTVLRLPLYLSGYMVHNF
jgi:hypothetical protein